MAVQVSTATYNSIVAQRDAAAAAVTQTTTQRDQAEEQRVLMQRQFDDLSAVVADLTTN